MTLERVIDWLLYLKDVKRYDRLSVEIDYEILLEIIDFLQELQSCRDSDRKHGRWEEVVHPADGLFGLYQPYTKCSKCGREVIGTLKFADKYCGNCGAEMENGGGKNAAD